MQALLHYIAQHAALPPEAVAQLAPHVQPLLLRKGDFFVRQGETCRRLAFIESGFLRLFYEADGRDITRDITQERTFLAAMDSYLSGKPSRENVQAITDCQLWTIQKGRLEALYDAYPALERLARKVLEQFFVGHQHRIYALIAEDAEQRYVRLMQERPELLTQVPLQYVASLLGISQPTLSRIRKRQVGK
jgi:CRP-like cAMP-binding protein